MALDGQGLKDGLLKALASNRIFAARAKLVETIELLANDRSPTVATSGQTSLVSRIVLLSEPSGEQFRARLRMKPVEPVPVSAPASHPFVEPRPGEPVPAGLPDPLELIDGLGRRAVEKLLDGGVTRYAEIAEWTSVQVGAWRARLDGLAHGSVGWWIEQAAVLAAGRSTHFADRVRRGEFASLATSPEPEPPRPWSPDQLPAHDQSPACTQDGYSAFADMLAPTLFAVPALPDSDVGSLKAEDLARTLAEGEVSATSSPPPLPERLMPVADAPQNDTEPATRGSAARGGYVRPRRGSEPLLEESEVRVIERAAAVAETALAKPDRLRPRTLRQRLEALQPPDRFEASSYAAYRGSIEEASVTILAAAGETRPAPVPAADSAVADSAASLGHKSRFLRALTGKT